MSERVAYTDRVVEGMESLYGKGFLSPGGAPEVDLMFDGVDLHGLSVLDLGCGLGGATVKLARDHHAGHVTGVDVVSDSVDRARIAAAAAGLDDRVTVRKIEPGPLPFDDGEFDAVLCKDVVCHMADKAAFMTEPFRVLKPGGRLFCADFFEGVADDGAHPGAAAFAGFVATTESYGLIYHFEPRAIYDRALRAAGFRDLEFIDHSAISAAGTRDNLVALSGPDSERIKGLLGDALFAARVRASSFLNKALESGGMEHCHMRAARPG